MTKRDKIVSTTIDLCGSHGLGDIPTARIAKEAGVATGTLFHHFSTKADLIKASYIAVYEDYVWNMIRYFDVPAGDLKKGLKKGIKGAINYWSRNPVYFEFTRQVRHSHYFDSDVRNRLKKIQLSLHTILVQAADSGVLRTMDHELMIDQIFASIDVCASRIIRAEHPEEVKQLKRDTLSFIWRAIARS